MASVTNPCYGRPMEETSLEPTPQTGIVVPAAANRLRVMADDFFNSLAGPTRRAYDHGLRSFAAFVGAASIWEGVGTLIARGSGEAFALVTRYRSHLQASGLRGASINRRLTAIRQIIRFANACDLIRWSIEVKSVKQDPMRDTRGPGREGMAKLFAAVAGDDPMDVRDRAVLRLLYSSALRRAEVCSLDLAHVNLDRGTIDVLGKGRTAREVVYVAPSVVSALRAWIAVRGASPSPALLLNFDPTQKGRDGQRLTPDGVHWIVKRAGKRAGVKCTAHALRHAGVTTAIEAMHGDVAKVQRFSRHRDVRTVMIYNDNLRAGARDVAALMDTMDGVPDER